MSTKIYNGYKAKVMTAYEVREFFIDFRKIVTPYIKDKCMEYISDFTSRIIIELVSHECALSGDFRKYENIIPPKNDSFNMIQSIIGEYVRYRDISIDAYIDDIFKNGYTKDLVDKVERESKYNPEETEREFFSSAVGLGIERFVKESKLSESKTFKRIYDLDFSCTVCITPIKRKTLFTAYGLMENYLEDLFNNDKRERTQEEKDFIKKWNVSYYGYWNNTDPLEGFSYERWNKRGKEWEEAIPDYASHYGFTLDFIGGELNLSALVHIYLDRDKLIEKIRDKIKDETRGNYCGDVVRVWVMDRYIKAHNIDVKDFSVYHKVHEESLKKYSEEFLKEVEDDIRKRVLELSNDDLEKNSVYKFIPTYNGMALEEYRKSHKEESEDNEDKEESPENNNLFD